MDEYGKHSPAGLAKNMTRSMAVGLGAGSRSTEGKVRWFGNGSEQATVVPANSPTSAFLQQLKNLEKKY